MREVLQGDGEAAPLLTGAATLITHQVHNVLLKTVADLCMRLEKVLTVGTGGVTIIKKKLPWP